MTRKGLRRQGMTLVLVTAIGVIVAILATTMIELGYHARILAVRDVQKIAARCAADAGLAEAVFKMQKKIIDEAVWDDSTLPSATNTTLANGARFSYTITPVESGKTYNVTSTGTYGQPGTTRRTYSMLETSSYWEGIGVKETVDIKLGTSFGVIGPGGPGDLTIRTNSIAADAMKFKAFVTVPGDVMCGPGGDPEVVVDVKATTVVGGEIYAAKESLTFPDVVPPPPPYTFNMGNFNGGKIIDTPGVYYFDSLNIPNAGVFQINVPGVTFYVAGKMTLNQSAEVIVNGGAGLTLYLGTTLEDKNSTGFSNYNGDDAGTLKIYGLPTCTDIDLKAKSDLAAAVYAPEANLDLYNSGSFTGAITAKSFDMKNSGNFCFDTRLLDVSIDDPTAVFAVGRWWED